MNPPGLKTVVHIAAMSASFSPRQNTRRLIVGVGGQRLQHWMRSIASGNFDVLYAVSPIELSRAIAAQWPALALYDISHLPDDGHQRMLAALQSLSISIVCISDGTRSSTMRFLQAARSGLGALLLYRADDGGVVLPHIAAAMPSEPPSAYLLRLLANPLLSLPGRVSGAIVDALAHPRVFADATGVALAAGLSRRSVDRWLTRAGITSASRLICAARLAHFFTYASSGLVARNTAASASGFQSGSQLRRYSRLIVGTSPGRLTRLYTPAQIASALESWCIRDYETPCR